MRRLAVLLAVVASAVVVLSTPAAATTITVDDANEYRQAIADLSTDTSGPHRIVLAADISLGGVRVPSYDSAQPLTIDGRGHVLRGRGLELVRGSGGALTIDDLTLTGAANAVGWGGPVIVRDSRFVGIGRGDYPRRWVGVVLGMYGRRPSVLLLTDTEFTDNLGRHLIDSVGSLTATRTTFSRNTSGREVLHAYGRIRLRGTTFARNVGSHEPAIHSDRGSVELVDTLVAENRRGGRAGAPVVMSTTEVSLVRSVIRDNVPAGVGRARVAVDTVDLVAARSVIAHPGRDCWVEGSTTSGRSIASDRSCGF